MKVWIKLLLTFALGFLMLQPAPLSAGTYRARDNAGLLSDEEISALEDQADAIARKYDINIILVTDIATGYSDNYARDYVEYHGEIMFPEGYIAYMINMADRSYWVDAYGSQMRDIFTQSVTDKLADRSVDALRDGDYYEAFAKFLDGVETQMAIHTSPLGVFAKPLLYPGLSLILTIASGTLAALLAWGVVAVKKNRHRDKKLAVDAGLYQGQLELTAHEDRFTHMYQTRVRVPESNSHGGGFSGGGGGGHTGSGGHF